MRLQRWIIWFAAAAWLHSAPPPVRAEGHDTAPPEVAWARSVSEGQKALAQRHFLEGLELHRQLLFAEAAEAYERACYEWEHPKFFLYRSHALVRGGEYMEAFRALQRAKSEPVGALSAAELQIVRALEAELMQKLAAITVTCDESGAAVKLNNQEWFECPESGRRIVDPGYYQVSVHKQGYVPVMEEVTLSAGSLATLAADMVTEAEAEDEARRWSRELPWIATGAGLLVSAAGAGLYAYTGWRARTWNEDIAALCTEDLPCSSSLGLGHRLGRARWQRTLSGGLLAAGGSALLASTLMHYLNQPALSAAADADDPRFDVQPLIDVHAAGLSLTSKF